MGQPTTLDWNAYGAASASIETAPPVRASGARFAATPEPAGPTN